MLIVTLAVLVVYFGSCYFHPYMKCKTCNRSRESYSTTFKGAFGKCRSCDGRGHHIRFGARVLNRK